MRITATVGHIHGAHVSCAGRIDENGKLGPGPRTVKNIYQPKDDSLSVTRAEYLALLSLLLLAGIGLLIALGSK